MRVATRPASLLAKEPPLVRADPPYIAKLFQGTGGLYQQPSWLVLGALVASQIATQLIFGSEDQHPHRRNPRFQSARDLGVTHLSVVTQHERHLKFLGQADQLFPHFELLFAAQNLGERRRSRIVGNVTKVDSIRART